MPSSGFSTMTDKSSFLDDESRRSFLRKGAFASGTLALGSSAVGTVAAQEDDDDAFVNDEAESISAAMFSTAFRPGGRFIITSPVVDWTPDVQQNIAGQFENFNTRVIQYVDTNEQVLFFQAQDAEVPPYNEDAGFVVDNDQEFGIGDTVQPEIYTFGYDQEVFGGQNRQGLISVTARPLEEDAEEDVFTDEGVVGAEQADEGFVGAAEDDDFQDNDNDADEGIFF